MFSALLPFLPPLFPASVGRYSSDKHLTGVLKEANKGDPDLLYLRVSPQEVSSPVSARQRQQAMPGA